MTTTTTTAAAGERARLQRTPCARTAPLRAASLAFPPAPPPTTTTTTTTGAAYVDDAVRAAYRGDDDDCARGRRAAGRMTARTFWTGRLAVDPRSTFGAAPAGDPRDVLRNAMRMWSDMMAMWLDLASVAPFPQQQQPPSPFTPFGRHAPPPPTPPTPATPTTSTTAVGARLDITVEVVGRPASVSIDVRAADDNDALHVEPLRALGAASTPPSPSAVAPSARIVVDPIVGRVHVRVDASDGAAAGAYVAAICTDSGAPRGAIRVVLS